MAPGAGGGVLLGALANGVLGALGALGVLAGGALGALAGGGVVFLTGARRGVVFLAVEVVFRAAVVFFAEVVVFRGVVEVDFAGAFLAVVVRFAAVVVRFAAVAVLFAAVEPVAVVAFFAAVDDVPVVFLAAVVLLAGVRLAVVFRGLAVLRAAVVGALAVFAAGARRVAVRGRGAFSTISSTRSLTSASISSTTAAAFGGAFGSFTFPDTTPASCLAGAKLGTNAFRGTFFPFLTADFGSTRSKVPKPLIATVSPFAISRVMVSTTASRACAAAFLLPSNRAARASINWDLFTICLSPESRPSRRPTSPLTLDTSAARDNQHARDRQ